MSWWEILLLVVVCVAFAVALVVTLYNKIKGKSGCDCGGSCGACGLCKKAHNDGNDRGCPHCASCAKDNSVEK